MKARGNSKCIFILCNFTEDATACCLLALFGVGVFSTSFSTLQRNLSSSMWTSMCRHTHIHTSFSRHTGDPEAHSSPSVPRLRSPKPHPWARYHPCLPPDGRVCPVLRVSDFTSSTRPGAKVPLPLLTWWWAT